MSHSQDTILNHNTNLQHVEEGSNVHSPIHSLFFQQICIECFLPGIFSINKLKYVPCTQAAQSPVYV